MFFTKLVVRGIIKDDNEVSLFKYNKKQKGGLTFVRSFFFLERVLEFFDPLLLSQTT